jgi:aryl-alcohol dehydrogenase-like predicted oxidoreductase
LRVNQADDILSALALAQRHPSVRLVLVGGAEADNVAEQLAAANVPLVLSPARCRREHFDRMVRPLLCVGFFCC